MVAAWRLMLKLVWHGAVWCGAVCRYDLPVDNACHLKFPHSLKKVIANDTLSYNTLSKRSGGVLCDHEGARTALIACCADAKDWMPGMPLWPLCPRHFDFPSTPFFLSNNYCNVLQMLFQLMKLCTPTGGRQ